MILAAVSLQRAPSSGDRRRDQGRARGQPVPLHRLHEDLRSRAAVDGRRGAPGPPGRSPTLMRSFLPSYRLRNAATLDAALTMLAEEPGAWRPFAGGTDLMVQLAAGTLQHRQYVNVFGLKELRYIDTASDAVVLGGLTTFSDVLRHQTRAGRVPAAVPRRVRDWRRGQSEPRHDRRQHRQRVARRRYAAGAARLRRRDRARLRARPARHPVRSDSIPATSRWTLPPTS